MTSYKITTMDLQNLHFKYAESIYKHYMSVLTSTQKYVSAEDLQDCHQEASLIALRTFSEVQNTLTKEMISAVRHHLENLYGTHQRTNAEKLRNSPAIGIDFGTSNSRVAVCKNKKLVVIPNSDGQVETPSYVAIDEDFETHPDVYVGEQARKTGLENPENCIFGMKEMLSKRWKEISKLDKLPYQIVIDKDNVSVKVGRFYSVEELIRTIIQNLKAYAEDYLGQSISSAVVTVPVRFNHRQRELLREACTMAGLNVLQIVNEPTAALLAYDSVNLSSSETKYYLLFDLSGRKLNATIFKCKNSKLQIVGFHEEFKGGDSFDKEMVKYCLKEFQREHGIKISSRESSKKDGRRVRRLQMECERQKRSLSSTTNVTVNVSSFYSDVDLVVPFSRRLFEKLNRENFMECLEKVDDVIEKSGLCKQDISQVVLSGGSSCIPIIQEKIRQYFKRDIILNEIPPVEVVSCGAAVLARGIKANPELVNVEVQEMEAALPRSRLGSDVLFDPSTPTVVREYPKRHTVPPCFKPHP